MKKLNVASVCIAALALVINVVARLSEPFCDWYKNNIFKIILNVYGRLTSLLPFSAGEVMIVAGVVLCLFFIASLCVKLWSMWTRRHSSVSDMATRYIRCFAFLASLVFLVMTMNCFVLYQAGGFAEEYFQIDNQYTLEELEAIRNKIVEKCNELSKTMERDNEGYLVYDGDINENAHMAMKALGKEYKGLAGYYPKSKTISFSKFMSQQYVAGIYFPFSMEANINGMMYISNYPVTVCHELAHTKGYIYEDEANFIAYLACINSDDVFFKYSGYLSVLYYVDEAYYESLADKERYFEQVSIENQVHDDNVFLTAKAWEEVEDSAVIDTETVEQIADVAIDTNLKVNGVEEGIVSYSKVVELMLEYEKQVKNNEKN